MACFARRGSLLAMSDRIRNISCPLSLLRGFFRWGSSMIIGGGGGSGIGSGRIFGFNLGLETFFCGFTRSLMAKGGLGGLGGLVLSGSAMGVTAGALGATVPSRIAILADPEPGGEGGKLPPFMIGRSSGCVPGADGPNMLFITLVAVLLM